MVINEYAIDNNKQKQIIMNTSCDPQNDLDCYYNNKWKSQFQSVKRRPINNFTILQEKINNEMFEFIMRIDSNNSDNSRNSVIDQMVKLRTNYFQRLDNSIYIIDLIESIRKINDTNSMAVVLKRLMHL